MISTIQSNLTSSSYKIPMAFCKGFQSTSLIKHAVIGVLSAAAYQVHWIGLGVIALAASRYYISEGKEFFNSEKEAEKNREKYQKNELEKQNCHLSKIENKEIILYLEAAADHNNAMKQQMLNSNNSNEYCLAYQKVSSLEDIDQAFTTALEQHNKIVMTILHAHGDSSSILLGQDKWGFSEFGFGKHVLSTRNFHRLKNLNKMESGAVIVFDVCESAKKRKFGLENIAQKTANHAKRTVLGAETYCSGICINGLNPPDVTFHGEVQFFFGVPCASITPTIVCHPCL